MLDTEPWTRTYSVRARATGRCLRNAGETTLIGVATPPDVTPYRLDGEGACALSEWSFSASMSATGAWKIASVEIEGHVLDVETASTAEGTRVILYVPPALAPNWHQRFFVRERANGSFQIAPLHAPELCLTDMSAGVEIWTCEPENAAQEWELLYDRCNAPVED